VKEHSGHSLALIQTSTPSQWIDEGLWYYSRHPNYFGEMSLWLGQFIAAASTLQGSQWACVISPIFVVFLLMKISGVPMLESRGNEKWGSDPNYRLYMENTHVILILPKGKKTLENIESPLVPQQTSQV
jgi:steroid 5-alpha reductase family enzyme